MATRGRSSVTSPPASCWTGTPTLSGAWFVWPFKADYRIVYLDPGYTQTIIGREDRDYVWIMARTPSIPEADYQKLLELLKREGYEVSKINKVPQQW